MRAKLAIAGVLLACAGCGSGGADGTDALASLQSLNAELAKLEADVASLARDQAVLDNELEYTRGLDRHDESLENSVFWREAAISYGTLVPFDELASWANASHANSAAHQHHVTTLTLDFDGDTAHEEGYIFYSSDMPRDRAQDVEGAPTPGRIAPGTYATLGSGRYVNRYERRGGDWRMIVHEYVHDISMRLEAVDLCATGCLGRWDRTDVSYLRPLTPLSVEERQLRAEQGKTPRTRTHAEGSSP